MNSVLAGTSKVTGEFRRQQEVMARRRLVRPGHPFKLTNDPAEF